MHKNFWHTNTFIIIGSIIYVLADSLLFSYYKYLIEIKYYYFFDVLLAEGIIYFSMVLISLCLLLLIQKINDSKTLFSELSEYNEKNGIWKILLCFFLNLIFEGFFIGLLDFLILKELTPNYVIIAYELGKVPSSIIENKDVNMWVILIISIFQIIFLLFYLEILEYNFCSLNINNKRNILEREKSQININNGDDNDSEVNFKGYDISEGLKKDIESLIELGDENSEGIVDK